MKVFLQFLMWEWQELALKAILFSVLAVILVLVGAPVADWWGILP